MSWTIQQENELRCLHAKGWSFSMISSSIGGGFTRNACIGKATRMGLCERAPRTRAPVQRLPRKPRVKFRPQKLTALMFDDAPVAEIPAGEPISKNLSLFALTSRTCRWPAGDDPPFLFCGHQPQHGSPYCPFHFQISLPPHQRKNSGMKVESDATNQKELVTV